MMGEARTSWLAWDSGSEYAEVDQVVSQHAQVEWTASHSGITKTHWNDSANQTTCSSYTCQRKFGFTERPHHCRRCGGIFCNECLKFRRKLNLLAHPDPEGKLHKVCQSCFDQGPQTLGQSRNWMQWFQYFNSQMRQHSADCAATGHRRRVNIEEECKRLREGFAGSTGGRLQRSLSEVKGIVSIPEWQKSKFWVQEKLAVACRGCRKEFSLTCSRHHCVICGLAVCSSCSRKDLLIFSSSEEVKIALIKIVGCPDKEPDVSAYLRVCQSCYDKLQEKQVAEYYAENHTVDKQNQCSWEAILSIHRQLTSLRTKVNDKLPKYQELVEALEIGPGSAASLPAGRSHIQDLAKAQCDLGDHFSQYVMEIVPLKKLKPTTRGQGSIVRNIVKANCSYYMDNMFTFRDLQKKLEILTPKEVLLAIQTEVNKKAIISSYVALRQLALEVLHLTTKHQLEQDLLQALLPVEQKMQEEFEACIRAAGEDYDEHQDITKQLVQEQLKTHRFIRPSNKLTKLQGSIHIEEVVTQRSESLIRQMVLQLQAKCDDRSFRNSKSALEDLLQQIPDRGFEKL